MTLKAIITETIPVGTSRRYNVGVAGTAPSGLHVYRPQFLHHGPWCKSTAREKARRLQNDLDHNRIGHLLGWFPEKPAANCPICNSPEWYENRSDGFVWWECDDCGHKIVVEKEPPKIRDIPNPRAWHDCTGNDAPQCNDCGYPKLLIWVRVGDAGEYESFDSLDDALDYLNELSVGEVTGWVDGGMGVGIETVNYHGYDFISLFWGDDDANLTAHLDADERVEVEAGLEEVYI